MASELQAGLFFAQLWQKTISFGRCKPLLFLGKVFEDEFCFGRADGFGEVVEGLQAHLFDRAETQQQVAGSLFANAGDVGQLGLEGSFAALVAMEADGETVHLVLYLFKEVEQLDRKSVV